jgi:hypothetical protein
MFYVDAVKGETCLFAQGSKAGKQGSRIGAPGDSGKVFYKMTNRRLLNLFLYRAAAGPPGLAQGSRKAGFKKSHNSFNDSCFSGIPVTV